MSAASDRRKANISNRLAYTLLKGAVPDDVYVVSCKVMSGGVRAVVCYGDGPRFELQGNGESRAAILELGRILHLPNIRRRWADDPPTPG